MSRALLRSVACGLIGVLLFAQLAIAAYACPQLSAAVAAQVAQTDAASGDPGGASSMPPASMPDCAGMAGTTDPSSANLCAEHCRYGKQSDYAPALTVPAALVVQLYTRPLVPEAARPSHPAATTVSALVAASPPHAILHCVYRI